MIACSIIFTLYFAFLWDSHRKVAALFSPLALLGVVTQPTDGRLSKTRYDLVFNGTPLFKATWSVRGFLFVLQNHVIRYKLYLYYSVKTVKICCHVPFRG